MSGQDALVTPRWSLQECRRATAWLRRSTGGRNALRALRPRGQSGMFRDRLPVSAQLYLAGLEGRLVVLDASAFALVQDPPAVADRLRDRRGRAARLHRVDAWWGSLLLAAPAFSLMLLALLALLVAGRGATVPALALVAAALGWVLVHLLGGLITAVAGAYRSVERTPDARDHAVSWLVSEHWSVPLLQAESPAVARELVRLSRAVAAQREGRLDRPRIGPGRSPLVLYLLDGMTTAAAREAVLQHGDVAARREKAPRMVALGDGSLQVKGEDPSYPARGIFLLLGATVVTLLVTPLVVLDDVRTTCAGQRCSGAQRYWAALRWLVSRFLHDPSAAPPMGWHLQVLGWLVSVLGLVVLVFVIVAVGRHVRFLQRGRRLVQDDLLEAVRLRRPTVGIVTTSPEETAAVRQLLRGMVHTFEDGDRNLYTVGQVPSGRPGQLHTVVVVQAAETGNVRSAVTGAQLVTSFDTVRCLVTTTIGSGVPRPAEPDRDVRPGDVVVPAPGLISLDHVDQLPEGPRERPWNPQPSELFKRLMAELETEQEQGSRRWESWLDTLTEALPHYGRPAVDANGAAGPRPRILRGPIGSWDRALRDPAQRDRVARERRLLAFESVGTGGAGVALDHRLDWTVIVGIGDLGDGGSSSTRRPAAVAVAAYLAALLEIAHPFTDDR